MATQDFRVLIVDDEAELRSHVKGLLQQFFLGQKVQIDEASHGRLALQMSHMQSYDLVIMDVRMPEMDGLTALSKIKDIDPKTFVVILTAHANINDAIRAIRDGAYDYLEKPVDSHKLYKILEKSREARQMVSDLAMSFPIFDDDVDSEIIGATQKMREVFNLIYKLSKVDTTVLIRGENGTGKELVAKAIHYNSPRKGGSFVAINCGAIPENLMESELFGHEKGAFTGAFERKIGQFQVANQGTLFLDEIGELRPDLQVKLLRALQEKKFIPVGGTREVKTNARIIAATNRNLEKMIQEGQFREDLFYRLNVLPIFLPPLRERKEDIELLLINFIKKFQRQHPQSPVKAISADALSVLKNHDWPGNIRELENVIERAFIIETSEEIQVSSLPQTLLESLSRSNSQTGSLNSLRGRQSGRDFDFEKFKEQAEKDFIVSALKANHGRINQTVANANIPKNTLLRKIKKYGINVREFYEE
jgi:DNA-binding NtrC family response regulator